MRAPMGIGSWWLWPGTSKFARSPPILPMHWIWICPPIGYRYVLRAAW